MKPLKKLITLMLLRLKMLLTNQNPPIYSTNPTSGIHVVGKGSWKEREVGKFKVGKSEVGKFR